MQYILFIIWAYSAKVQQELGAPGDSGICWGRACHQSPSHLQPGVGQVRGSRATAAPGIGLFLGPQSCWGWAGTWAHKWAQLRGGQGRSGQWGAGDHQCCGITGVRSWAVGGRGEPQEGSGTVRAGHDPGFTKFPPKGKRKLYIYYHFNL